MKSKLIHHRGHRGDSTRSRRGQTLVEALVALSILTVGFVGITTLLTESFRLNRTTADDTQATYLASEGIEIVKNLIDHDVYFGLAESASTSDWSDCFPSSGYYYPIDYETLPAANDDCSGIGFTPINDPAPAPTPLYFDPTADLYTATDGAGDEPTDFTRLIEINDNDRVNGTPEEIDVQSTVTWTNGTLSNTITLEDQFYDWHP